MHRLIYRKLTFMEHCILHRIKYIAAAIGIAIGLCGCCTVTNPGWGVVNNTGYDIVVFQNGQEVAKLHPGGVLGLTRKYLEDNVLVSITAYDKHGRYVGADTYTFSSYRPYNWQLDHVHQQEGVR